MFLCKLIVTVRFVWLQPLIRPSAWRWRRPWPSPSWPSITTRQTSPPRRDPSSTRWAYPGHILGNGQFSEFSFNLNFMFYQSFSFSSSRLMTCRQTLWKSWFFLKLSSLRRTPDWILYSSSFYSAKSTYLSNHNISSINLHSKLICILLKDKIKVIHPLIAVGIYK